MPRETLEYMAVTGSPLPQLPELLPPSALTSCHSVPYSAFLAFFQFFSHNQLLPASSLGTYCFFLIGMLCPRTSTFFAGSSANLKCRHFSSNFIKNLKIETAAFTQGLGPFVQVRSPEQMHRAYPPTAGPAFSSALHMASSPSLKSSCLAILSVPFYFLYSIYHNFKY